MLLKHLKLLYKLSKEAQAINDTRSKNLKLSEDDYRKESNLTNMVNAFGAHIRGLDRDSLIFVFKHAPTNEYGEIFGQWHARDLIPAELKNDPDVLRAVLKSDACALYGAGQELRGNVEFMKWADDFTGGYAFQYALDEALESQELFDIHIMCELTNNDIRDPLRHWGWRDKYNNYLRQKLNDPEFVKMAQNLIKNNKKAPKEKLSNLLDNVKFHQSSSMGE